VFPALLFLKNQTRKSEMRIKWYYVVRLALQS
jgi:hypothetical protein